MEYLPEENKNSAEETNKCAETKDEAKKDTRTKLLQPESVKTKKLALHSHGVAAPIERSV